MQVFIKCMFLYTCQIYFSALYLVTQEKARKTIMCSMSLAVVIISLSGTPIVGYSSTYTYLCNYIHLPNYYLHLIYWGTVTLLVYIFFFI